MKNCSEKFKVQGSKFKVIGRPVAAAIRLKLAATKLAGAEARPTKLFMLQVWPQGP
jgi:hypothetical protein